jgi:uncharacterized membrane protein YkoI
MTGIMETDFTRRLLLKALFAALLVELGRPVRALAKDGGDDGGGDDGGDDGGDGDDKDGGKGSGRGRGRRRRGDDDKGSRSGGASLKAALDNVRMRYPGRVVEVELNNFRGRRVYEIKVVDNKGRLFEVYCDVRTGNIIKVERD